MLKKGSSVHLISFPTTHLTRAELTESAYGKTSASSYMTDAQLMNYQVIDLRS